MALTVPPFIASVPVTVSDIFVKLRLFEPEPAYTVRVVPTVNVDMVPELLLKVPCLVGSELPTFSAPEVVRL